MSSIRVLRAGQAEHGDREPLVGRGARFRLGCRLLASLLSPSPGAAEPLAAAVLLPCAAAASS